MAKGTEESKGEDSKLEQLMAAMTTQNAQHEQGLAQMREAQALTQQTQTQIMQMMGMMYAGQEQQRVTNLWVAKSMETISASSGCAIEAAPAPQEIVALPPALVRMAQSAPGGAESLVDPMVTESVMATAAAAADAAAPMAAASEGGGALPLSLASKRNAKSRGAGAASATAAAIKSAANTPIRKSTKLPPGHGAGPTPEDMDGLDSDEKLYFKQHFDEEEVGEDAQPHPYGTADVLKCLYANLYGNEKPTKAQMMAGGERERTSSEIEADAQRVEEKLLTATPSPQDF